MSINAIYNLNPQMIPQMFSRLTFFTGRNVLRDTNVLLTQSNSVAVAML